LIRSILLKPLKDSKWFSRGNLQFRFTQ